MESFQGSRSLKSDKLVVLRVFGLADHMLSMDILFQDVLVYDVIFFSFDRGSIVFLQFKRGVEIKKIVSWFHYFPFIERLLLFSSVSCITNYTIHIRN